MAKVKNLSILNPADKTHHYTYAVCEGAIADEDDVVVTDTHKFPLGSRIVDTTGKAEYVRIAEKKAVADFMKLAPGA